MYKVFDVILMDMNKEMIASVCKAADQVGKLLVDKVHERIAEGDPSWQALAPSTIARKGSALHWKDTGRLEKHVKYKKECSKVVPWAEVHVGVWDPGRSKIAKFNEFGTSKMPARPLFGPVLSENESEVLKIFKG